MAVSLCNEIQCPSRAAPSQSLGWLALSLGVSSLGWDLSPSLSREHRQVLPPWDWPLLTFTQVLVSFPHPTSSKTMVSQELSNLSNVFLQNDECHQTSLSTSLHNCYKKGTNSAIYKHSPMQLVHYLFNKDVQLKKRHERGDGWVGLGFLSACCSKGTHLRLVFTRIFMFN